MKLHLTLPLRRALLRCALPMAALSASFTLPAAALESVEIPDGTVWETGNAPGYLGSDANASYSATNGTWNINSGAYDISAEQETSDNDETSAAIKLDNAELNNSGQLSTKSIKNPEYDWLYYNGVCLTNGSILTNTKEGTLTATTETPGNDGGGDYHSAIKGDASTLVNEGTLYASAMSGDGQAREDVKAVEMRHDSVLNNSGSMILKAEGADAVGLYKNSGSISTNTGSIDINVGGTDLDVTYDAYGIRMENYENGGWYGRPQLFNDGGSINISATGSRYTSYVDNTTGDTVWVLDGNAYGIHISNGLLENTNGGTVTAHADAHGASDAVAYGIYVYGDHGIINDETSRITATANNRSTDGSCPISAGLYVKGNVLNMGALHTHAEASASFAWVAGTIVDNLGGLFNAGEWKTDKASISGGSLSLMNGSANTSYHAGSDMNIHGYGKLCLGGELASEGVDYILAGDYGYGILDRVIAPTAANNSFITIGTNLNITVEKNHELTLYLLDNTTLAMGGDLNIASEVTQNWNGYTLTVDNGNTSRNVTLGDSFKGSWDGAMTLAQTSSGFSMVQEGEVSNISQSGGEVVIGGEGMKASNTMSIGRAEETTKMTAAGDTLALSSGKGGTVTNSTLAAKNVSLTTETGSKLTLEDVAIELDEGGLGTLENAEIRGNSTISSVGGAVVAKNVTMVLDGINSQEHTSPATAALLLADVAEEQNTLITMSDIRTFVLDSGVLQGVEVSGSFTLDLTAWRDEIIAGNYEAFAVTFDEGTSFAEDATISATLDGKNYVTPSQVSGNTVTFKVSAVEGIPEPTTATLSLLALAGLAARRRRK